MSSSLFQNKIISGIKGLILVALGIFFISHPEKAAVNLLYYIGLIMMFFGLIILINTIRTDKSHRNSIAAYLLPSGIILSGIFLLFFAKHALIFFAFLAGLLILTDGISLLSLTGFSRSIGRLLSFFGIFSVLLGLLILMNPTSLIVLLSVLFGVIMILSGIFILMISFKQPG